MAELFNDCIVRMLLTSVFLHGLLCMQVEEIVGGFNMTEDQMTQIMRVMESEMSLGLSRKAEDRKKSSLQMENTFVHQTMDGTGK